MSERSVSVSLDALLAWFFFVAGVFMMLLDAFQVAPTGIRVAGIALVLLGQTLVIRVMLRNSSTRISDAFELGREAGVRSLR